MVSATRSLILQQRMSTTIMSVEIATDEATGVIAMTRTGTDVGATTTTIAMTMMSDATEGATGTEIDLGRLSPQGD